MSIARKILVGTTIMAVMTISACTPADNASTSQASKAATPVETTSANSQSSAPSTKPKSVTGPAAKGSVLADGTQAGVAASPVELAEVTGDLDVGLAALDKNDFALAAREFAAAFDKGEADGAFYLGRMYETGAGAPANVAQAVQIYRAGIEKGSFAAMNRLGVMHLEGTGVLQDFSAGAKLICEAGDKGDVNGQFNCGTLYMDGRGVDVDNAKAVDYFRKAAGKDHIAARNFLGLSYISGNGVEADQAKAVEQFKKTAERGNLLGMVHLGKHYADEEEKGHRDLELSHMYFNLAASSGHPTAAQNRDQVQSQMTNDQIEAAQERARNWKPVAP